MIVAVVGGVLSGLVVATAAVAVERSLPLPPGERHHLAIAALDPEPLPALVAPRKRNDSFAPMPLAPIGDARAELLVCSADISADEAMLDLAFDHVREDTFSAR